MNSALILIVVAAAVLVVAVWWSRKQAVEHRRKQLEDARAEARRWTERLGGQVLNLVGTNEAAKQALADASERHGAAISQLDQADSAEKCRLTTETASIRQQVLRMYWDGEAEPSVEVPLGDFFCNGWVQLALVDSAVVVVAPAGGFNSYWPMPFRSRALITLENTGRRTVPVYYQVTYQERELPERIAHFHASWRRNNPLGEPAVHTIVDGIEGSGQYVGTYLAVRPGASGWWGEGEVKFYLDGDREFPTICGTGTEDYFGGAWNFDVDGRYVPYSTACLGMPQVLPPNEIYKAHQRFGLYRWHLPDPIAFERDLRVTVQALG